MSQHKDAREKYKWYHIQQAKLYIYYFQELLLFVQYNEL
nr:MAG TPA: hypothetical protein [Caudoviricetes sp.]